MAANFKIVTNRVGKNNIIVNLIGDFDGTSAWELIRRLEQVSGKNKTVEVNTNRITSLASFGLGVLRSNVGSFGAAGFVFSGKNAHYFSDM